MNSKSTKTNRRLMIAVVLLVAGVAGVSAQQTGAEIMQRVYERPRGDSMSAELSMTITNSRGSTRERSIVQFQLDGDEVQKKLMFFTAPADVRDTSFMIWSYDDGRNDDQWIYLPALRRVRRISADGQSDSFMGSDFSFEDLSMRHPSLDSHTILREETIGGKDYYVVESVPREGGTAYARTRSWIAQDTFLGIRREFVNADGEVFKELTVDDVENVDSFWVITDMTMRNLQTSSSTRIQMNDVDFESGRADGFFSERQMQRGPR